MKKLSFRFLLIPLLLMASAPGAFAQAGFVSEAVSLQTPTGTLHGTLVLPQGSSARVPVVLFISGSGPTDRDGNTAVMDGNNDSLKMLAEALAARGIASLRYDKRGVAESLPAGPSEEALRFDTYIEDAVAWGRDLRSDRRFSSVMILGHSEGSLVGMVAAHHLQANGFISVAGTGRRGHELLRSQVQGMLPDEMFTRTEAVLQRLAAGERAPDYPPELDVLFRPSIQPYLISWFQYDPVVEIARLRMPVLIVQGTTDLQIKTENAQMLAHARPSAKLLVVQGMNHVLKAVPMSEQEQMRAYMDPSLPLVPALVEGVSRFVLENARQ